MPLIDNPIIPQNLVWKCKFCGKIFAFTDKGETHEKECELYRIKPWWVKVLQVLWRGIKRTISDIKEYRRIERGRAILSDNIAKKDRRNGEINGGRKLVEENHNDRI